MRSIRFCFPTTLQRAPVPRLFPAHRPRVFLARAPGGLPPTETGDRAFHDAPNRFSGSRARVVMACWALPGFSWPQVFPWATTPCDRASDAPVATLADAGARIFRGARVPTPPEPPRLLRPRSRERTKFSPAQDAFPRQGARCSSSALSSGDRAPFLPADFIPQVPTPALADLRRPAPAVLSHPETR